MSEGAEGTRPGPIRVIPLDEKETRFQLEERAEDEEEKRQKSVVDDKSLSGCRPLKTMVEKSNREFDLERQDGKGDNREPKVETIVLEGEKVVGYKDEDSRTDGWKESFERLDASPTMPLLEDPLPTGVACCLTRLTNT